MDANELIRIKKTIDDAQRNIQKAEGSLQTMLEQLKERGYNSEEEAKEGILEIEKKLKKYNVLYKKSTDKLKEYEELYSPETDSEDLDD